MRDLNEAGLAILQARDLSFVRNGNRLVDGVSLEVKAGLRTLIVGPNGAGKSLLLRLLHGLIEPTSGMVLWDGRTLDRAARNQQAMVFQRPVLLRRSVAGNLRFALSALGLPRHVRREREAEALATARLEHLARQPARFLSGGEQQRLALARALAARPRLLLLDEPTASLDPASVHAVETLIDQAHARGTTVLMVTHDRDQAKRMGDELIFLHQGRTTEVGSVPEVLTTPRSDALRAWTEGRLFLDT